MPVPRLAPPTTLPVTAHQCPSISAAPFTSPCAISARMALEENTSPPSATGAITLTPKPISAPARCMCSGAAAAIVAEEEIVADDDVPNAETGHQHVLDEFVG